MRITIIAAIAAITINASHARIGETMEEAIRRYGQPTPLENEWTAFYKGDFQVNVQFYQGKIDKIEYLKTNQNTLKTVELSEVEVNNFLKANYKGTWQVDPSGPKGWFTPGGQLFAFQSYRIVEEEPNRSYYRLLIMTGESVQRFTNQLAIQETAAQSGF